MAYQNVQTPRFYINVLEWLAINRVIELPDDYEKLFKTPVDHPLHYFPQAGAATEENPEAVIFNIDNILPEYFETNGFLAILAHNLGQQSSEITGLKLSTGQKSDPSPVNFSSIVNGGDDLYFARPSYNGFSLWELTENFDLGTVLVANPTGSSQLAASSFVLGTYFDMPHSPDLNVKISREMDGVKHTRTRGGNELTKRQYTKAPLWGSFAPWEIGNSPSGNQGLARSGRRVWDISYSFLQDSDLFPMLSSLMPYESSSDDDDPYSEDGSTNWHEGKTLLDGNTFYNKVLHRTNLGQLSFIFNPAGGGDSPDNSPQNFAICKFDMKNFTFKQVANGVYNIKMKIREVW